MPTRLDWRVGPTAEEAPLAEPPTPTVLPGRRKPITVLLLAAVYGGAVLIAAWLGFQLGQWSDARATGLGDVSAQIAIEQLAWREGDLDLYLTTLDPVAPESWRQELAWQFDQESPLEVEIRLVEVEVVEPGLARAMVSISRPDGTSTEVRSYRRSSGQAWYRTGPGIAEEAQ